MIQSSSQLQFSCPLDHETAVLAGTGSLSLEARFEHQLLQQSLYETADRNLCQLHEKISVIFCVFSFRQASFCACTNRVRGSYLFDMNSFFGRDPNNNN